MKLIITGGHITPALAVISELQKKQIKIILIGRKFQPGTSDYTFEYQSVQNLNVTFINLNAGRLSRIISFRSLVHLIKIYSWFNSILPNSQKGET